jgi:hypothetical protein
MAKSETLRVAAENSVKELAEEAPAIREELARIVESNTFRASKRSQEFLDYTVQKALDERFEELKERVIGSALFGRPADYDTGTDSIVRVVANETRRRLQRFYQQDRECPRIRIDLPLGSYIPNVHRSSASALPEAPEITGAPILPLMQAVDVIPPIDARSGGYLGNKLRGWPILLIIWGFATLSLTSWSVLLLVQNRSITTELARKKDPRPNLLPWSALFQEQRGIHIVLADTSIGGIQNLLQSRLSLSDYLNRRFLPEDGRISPEKTKFLQFLVRNQFTSASYAITGIRIARLAQYYQAPVSVSFARELSLRTFKGGDNFVVLGTARANPWAQLFEPQLNFVLEFGDDDKEPFFRNRAPKPGERSIYIPSSDRTATLRESYGHVAFLPDVYQPGGHMLFVTGTSSQATEAAGEFVTNVRRLGAELNRSGLKLTGAPKPFEVLLRVRHTAGAPVRSEVIAVR